MTTEIIYTHKGKIEVSESRIRIDLVTIDDTNTPAKKSTLLFDTGAFITVIRKERAHTSGYKIIAEKACIISGFSEKGLVCDLRKIPTAVFCGFRLDDILVATPHDDGVRVSEVLGMNIIENFDFGVSLSKKEIYLNVRHDLISQKPRYQVGKVSLFCEEQL